METDPRPADPTLTAAIAAFISKDRQLQRYAADLAAEVLVKALEKQGFVVMRRVDGGPHW